jgi:branched-chain amino acid aminotransferase
MEKGAKYFIQDGQYFSVHEPSLTLHNRSFLYGDSLFESMHAYATEVPLLNFHFERLLKSMGILNMNIPRHFDILFLRDQIRNLCNKNRFFKSTRVRLTIFRKPGGLYTPESNDVSFLMETVELPFQKFMHKSHGITLGLYTEYKKQVHVLSSLKSANALLFVMAGIFNKQNNFDDCIILNENGHVIETIASNIFVLIDGKVHTPPISDGCLPGVMREAVIKLIGSDNVETGNSFDLQLIEEADEIFLSNAVSGLTSVRGYMQRRYFAAYSKDLAQKLNEEYF